VPAFIVTEDHKCSSLRDVSKRSNARKRWFSWRSLFQKLYSFGANQCTAFAFLPILVFVLSVEFFVGLEFLDEADSFTAAGVGSVLADNPVGIFFIVGFAGSFVRVDRTEGILFGSEAKVVGLALSIICASGRCIVLLAFAVFPICLAFVEEALAEVFEIALDCVFACTFPKRTAAGRGVLSVAIGLIWVLAFLSAGNLPLLVAFADSTEL
jgi:hypothetical protein